ncbi:VanZ family protein [Marinilactibacillus piezotolerans]|uniref:VanZ family protein n=1 Tax=Marinilactibacillus piezotolerans TaxID=258723 RepID=UPI0009AF6FB0|nr:VanZ family protein [Marinilactibacillus piezotolerans]
MRKQTTSFYPILFAWLAVLIWMAIIFWFSSQPANESAELSFSAMEVAGQVVSHWRIVGIAGFVAVFSLFLVWLGRRDAPLWGKVLLFILFLLFCAATVYFLIGIVRPRFSISELREMNYYVLHNFLRKNAHFFIYLLLGIIVKNALSTSGVNGVKAILLALIICAAYASTDEFHQRFIPGRTALVSDVLIDSTGSFLGIIFYSFLDWISGRRSIWQAFWNTKKR